MSAVEKRSSKPTGSGRHTLRSDALLFIASAIWGFAFVAQLKGMDHLGPYFYNGVRFALGALALLPLAVFQSRRAGRGKSRGPSAKKPGIPGSPGAGSRIMGGIVAGTVLTLGASFQQVGLQFTTAGKAGFITGLYVVFVPILGMLIKQHTGKGTWVGAILAVIGLYLLGVTERSIMGRGDFLVLASSFFFACHVLTIGHFARRSNIFVLSSIQFSCCSLLSMAAAFFTEPIEASAVRQALVPILYGGLGSVGIGYTLQVAAQRNSPASHSAIIMNFESLFAVLGGMIFLAERMSLRGYIGCAFMLAGMLASQGNIIFSAFPRRAP